MLRPKSALRRHLPPPVYAGFRRTRRLGRRRPAATLAADLGMGRCGKVLIRPVRTGDGEAWGEAMRAAAPRMLPWWSLDDDLDLVTDPMGFHDHATTWARRLREGTGACLAASTREALLGELQIWHLHPGGRTCEVGLWLRPDGPSREALACFAYVLDRLVAMGVERIDAPVAVGNDLPRRFFALVGFEVEATIPKWRELHGQLVDYDLMTLTPSRWAAARSGARAALGEWGAVSA